MLLHALQHLPGRGLERRVRPFGLALARHLRDPLPQAVVTCGPLNRIGAHGKARVVQEVELANPFDPGQGPFRELRMGVGQLDEITPLMGPAEGQKDRPKDSRELLVARVAITDDDPSLAGGQFCDRHRRRSRRVKHKVNHRFGVKHPQVPAMTDLPFGLGKHHPAGFIRVPAILALQSATQRVFQRLE